MTVTESGRTKTITLAAGQVAEVAAAIERYEAARAELEATAAAGLDRLRAARGASRGRQ